MKGFEEKLKKAIGAKAEDLMSKDVIWIKENDTVEDAATLMVEKGISRLPVFRKGKLVGIVSKADILKVLSRA